MQSASLPARSDTMLGICQGLGEDLGVSPQLLRVALAGLLFFNPLAAVATYAAAGLFVAALRWLIPNPKIASAPQREEAAAEPQREARPAEASHEAEAGPVALAA